MKKTFRIAPVILLCMFLCGCASSGKPSPIAYVTGIRVLGNYRGHIIQREYTQTEKIETVLNYLRTLDARGHVLRNPRQLPGNLYRITVFLSDGTTRHYLQRADRYLSGNGSDWQHIDRLQARDFYGLLLLTPTDL